MTFYRATLLLPQWGLYRFVLTYNDYMNTRHSYTEEEALTTLEAHLLTDICDYPDSTVTKLANAWGVRSVRPAKLSAN